MQRLGGVLIAAALLCGCSAQSGDEIKVDLGLAPAYQSVGHNAEKPAMQPQTPWWTAFGDSVLNRLVEEALAQNLDIKQATQRVESARLQARINESSALPTLAATAQGTLAGNRVAGKTTTNNNAGAGLKAGWLINPLAAKATLRADAAQIAIRQEELNQVRLELLSDLALAWMDARASGRQLVIAERTLAVQRQTADITEARQAAGAANALDSARARASVASTAADIPDLIQSRQDALSRVAVLLGKTPSELGKLDMKPLQKPRTGDIAEGIPADLVRNRPDLRTAEQSLELAIADIGLAESQLLPSITLSGSISASSPSPTITAWSFGPSITLPLFDRGKLHDGVDLARSDAKAEYLAWKQAVISAVGEVESAVVSYRQERLRRDQLSVAVKEYKTASELARKLFDAGTISFDIVLDAESSLYRAELQLALSDAQVAADFVALCKALGGGWAPGEATASKS